MRAYVDVRARGEAMLRESGLPHTVLRPWYVLGPGHRWAYALIPFYWYWNARAATRETAQRLGLLRLDQMLAALTWAVETASDENRVLEVPALRQFSSKKLPKTSDERTTV
jgi:uncharacterized protein YbjT (DUF2867 family)